MEFYKLSQVSLKLRNGVQLGVLDWKEYYTFTHLPQ